MTSAVPTIYYVIGAIVLVAIVVAAIMASKRAQSTRLRRRFGPEYDRATREQGDRARAERELAKREERVKKFHLQELPPGARERYADEWRHIQARFVDEPKTALSEADKVVTDVMRDRGYPIVNFEQRAADLSPDHASTVQDYRTAHDVTVRSNNGAADTEDLRQAMVHYREIFTELVGTTERTTS